MWLGKNTNYHFCSIHFANCYSLNVFVPLKFICWNPNAQGNDIKRYGLWEVIRGWGWNLQNGVSAITLEAPRALTLPPCEDTAGRCYLCNWPILNLGITCLSFYPGIKHLKNDIIAHQMPKVYELIIGLLWKPRMIHMSQPGDICISIANILFILNYSLSSNKAPMTTLKYGYGQKSYT